MSACITPKMCPSVSLKYASHPMPGIGILGTTHCPPALAITAVVASRSVDIHGVHAGLRGITPRHQPAVDPRLAVSCANGPILHGSIPQLKLPAKDFFIKRNRAPRILGRNLKVNRSFHRYAPVRFRILLLNSPRKGQDQSLGKFVTKRPPNRTNLGPAQTNTGRSGLDRRQYPQESQGPRAIPRPRLPTDHCSLPTLPTSHPPKAHRSPESSRPADADTRSTARDGESCGSSPSRGTPGASAHRSTPARQR